MTARSLHVLERPPFISLRREECRGIAQHTIAMHDAVYCALHLLLAGLFILAFLQQLLRGVPNLGPPRCESLGLVRAAVAGEGGTHMRGRA